MQGEGSRDRGLGREKVKRTGERQGEEDRERQGGEDRNFFQGEDLVWAVFRVSTLQKGHPYSRRTVYEGMIDCMHTMYLPVSTLIFP